MTLKKKLLTAFAFMALAIFMLVTAVCAGNIYGTDEEKLNKTVEITLSDGSTKEVHIYEMVVDAGHADFGKVLAVTWYYNENSELTWSFTNEVITVDGNGRVSYNGIDPMSVVVANFQCDVTHSDHTHNDIKYFNFKYWNNDSNPNTNLQYVFAPDTLQEIVRDFCRKCKSLKRFDLTENSQLKAINIYAFDNASSLESFYVPANVSVLPNSENASYGLFYNCASLKSVTFDSRSKLTMIGLATFAGCSALESINVPDTVTRIGDYCFRYCAALERVDLPDSVTYLGSFAFQHSDIKYSPFSLNSQCETIGQYAFDHTLSLTEIVIPSGVTSLPGATGNYGTFYGCTSLIRVIFAPNSQLTKIGNNCFSYCTAISELLLPDSLQIIEGNAFYNCAIVNSPFSTSSGVVSIGNMAFQGCTRLELLNIPAGLTTISEKAFYGCTALEAVYFNENSQLTTIQREAFANCSSLVTISLPEGLETLTDRTFSGCKSLKEMVLPNSLTTIGVRIFQSCSSLKRVVFGAGLTTVTTENDHHSLTYQSGVNEVVLPATFTADSFTGGGKTTYVFTNSNTVFYYAGTQEQFDGIVALLKGTEGNAAFNTVPTVENGRLVLITSCEGFYNNEHAGEKTVEYENGFASSGVSSVTCTRCQNVVSEELAPIIVALGYSTGVFDADRIMIASGFTVDVDLVALYESANGVSLEFGILFANSTRVASEKPQSLDGFNIITDEGKTFATYNYIVTFPAQGTENYSKYENFEFVVSAFACENGVYSFYQGNDAFTVKTTLESGFTTTTLANILNVIPME